ncbi:AAEL005329-PA, partial [Aedes aegypti]
ELEKKKKQKSTQRRPDACSGQWIFRGQTVNQQQCELTAISKLCKTNSFLRFGERPETPIWRCVPTQAKGLEIYQSFASPTHGYQLSSSVAQRRGIIG